MLLRVPRPVVVRRLASGVLWVGSSIVASGCAAPCSPAEVAIPIDSAVEARLIHLYGSRRLPTAECAKLCEPIGAQGGAGSTQQTSYSWSGCSLLTIETPDYVGPGIRCEGDFCPPVGGVGRRPSGAFRAPTKGTYFARAAAHEAAAAHAFDELALALALHRAPSELVESALRAADDEIEHANAIAALARASGAAAELARVTTSEVPSLEKLAEDNATEGLVFEGFGVHVLRHQARHAGLALARPVLARVARDEARHHDLARKIHRWASSRVSPRARRRIDEARRDAETRLRMLPPEDETDAWLAGLPSDEEHDRLAHGFDSLAPLEIA